MLENLEFTLMDGKESLDEPQPILLILRGLHLDSCLHFPVDLVTVFLVDMLIVAELVMSNGWLSQYCFLPTSVSISTIILTSFYQTFLATLRTCSSSQ